MSIEDTSGITGPQRYLALDALRGAAAFAVLFYHLRNLDAPGRPASVTSLFASGYLAVDLFFLLSGFIIAHAYGARLGTVLGVRAFLLARLIRLQPVIALGTLVGFAVALASRMAELPGAPGLFAIATTLPPNLLMLPNPLVPWGIFLFNPPAWSLFYELLANGIYAMMVTRFAKARAVGGNPLPAIMLIAVAMAGLVGLVVSVATCGDLDRGVVLGDWPTAMARITFSFTAGLLLHRTRLVWMPAMPRVPLPALLLACLVLLALAPVGPLRALYDLAFVAALSPLLVMTAAVIEPRGGWIRVAAWLGMISYPLYALHAPIKHLVELALPLDFALLLPIATFAALFAAWLVGTAIDPAARRWLGRRLGSRHEASGQAGVPATAVSSGF